MTAVAATPARRISSLFWPTIATLLMTGFLVSLGAWQMHRLAWKTSLIDRVAARATTGPVPVPLEGEWAGLVPDDYAYRHVTFDGTYENNKEVKVFRPLPVARGPIAGVGYLVLTPFRLSSGGIVIVNRGFVPLEQAEPATRAAGQIEGPTTVTGLMREPEARNIFTPSDDPAQRTWYTRDPQSIGAALGVPAVAPFTVDADAKQASGGLPQGGETVLSFSNDHLSYALTWFGLALGLVGVYVVYAWRALTGWAKPTSTGP